MPLETTMLCIDNVSPAVKRLTGSSYSDYFCDNFGTRNVRCALPSYTLIYSFTNENTIISRRASS